MIVKTHGMGDTSSSLISGGISAGVGLATGAAALWLNSIQLSHQADTATTQVVNGLEPLLRANVAAYLNGPGTCADQAAALGAYLSAVQWLFSAAGCGNGAYGSAGNRCISDRFGPGGATDSSGARWPWAAYYYDPIKNDPRAVGCAAQIAASNPAAAEQAAIANILNLTSGSNQQTTAGMFAGDLSQYGGAAAPVSNSGGSIASGAFSITTPVLGIPIWVWAAGVGAFALLK